MATKQEYKKYRVNNLPTSGLSSGDTYALNVGGGKYQTYVVSDTLQLTKEAGADFLEKDTVAELRAITAREIWAIQNGYYKGVKLNGYYAKGDTPASIDYYISSTVLADDGGSVIAVGSVKFEHKFKGEVNALYFGMITMYASIDVDNGERLQKAMDYAQRQAPNNTLDVYIPCGWYKFKTGVNISANGWTGRLYGDGVGQYSTRLLADDTLPAESIHALVYTRYVMDGSTRKDRFGNTFNANGNFEISNIVFSGGQKTASGTTVDYTSSSVCKYGVDISSSSYVKVFKCEFNRCLKGLSVSKWHGVVKNNGFKNSTYGMVLSEVNDYNTPSGASGDIFSLALNNFLISENNFSTNKHHVMINNGAYFLKIKDNVFDLCAGSSLIGVSFNHIVCNENYFEANNMEGIGHSVSYTGLGGTSVTENVNANCIFYRPSNYTDQSVLDFENNQCANNTGNVNNPFLALMNVMKYSVRDISFRNYENGGVVFFGNVMWNNNFANINSSGIIDFDWRYNKPKVKYSSNSLIRKGICNLKIIDKSTLNQVYIDETKKIFDNDIYSFVYGNPAVTATFRPIIVSNNSPLMHNENYTVTLNSAKYFYSKYDLTGVQYKPKSISIDLSIFPQSISSTVVFNVQILLDGVVHIDTEPFSRFTNTSNVTKSNSFNNTYLLDKEYDIIEIKVTPNTGGNYIVGDFCIRSSDLDPSYKSKETIASSIIKGVVNQAVAQPPISQVDLVAITTPDATDEASLITLANAIKAFLNTNAIPLINATKASQNTELSNQRTAGQQAT